MDNLLKPISHRLEPILKDVRQGTTDAQTESDLVGIISDLMFLLEEETNGMHAFRSMEARSIWKRLTEKYG